MRRVRRPGENGIDHLRNGLRREHDLRMIGNMVHPRA